MSFFRNVEKIVSSQLFTKPNSILLSAKHRPVYLCESITPVIQHLHTAKSLLQTIDRCLQFKDSKPNYSKAIDEELKLLNQSKIIYSENVGKFVERRGLVTAQGIANVYYSAQKLGFNSQWLEKNIHHDIPSKLKFMSRSNLKDTIDGVKKYHPSSPYLQSLEKAFSQKPEETMSYCQHFKNNSSKYEYVENTSNNCLINAIESNTNPYVYEAMKLAGTIVSIATSQQHKLNSE